jgi:hypothetical protein
MPKLLSGSTLRSGGSGQFLNLRDAQPQLPPTPTTSTGYSIVTDSLLRSEYRSSLGNIEMNLGQMYSNLPGQDIRLIATDSTRIVIAEGVPTTSTNTGALVVEGSIGVWGTIHTGEDIVVNGITMGRGYEGLNNIAIRGTADPQIDNLDNGQETIAIGFDTLLGINTSYKSIGIGRYALSSGTGISRNIAIGDSALKMIGVYPTLVYATITNITLANPIEIEAPGHDLTSGTHIVIKGVDGTIELNNNLYYVWAINSTTIALYGDPILNSPVDGTGFTAYVSSGTVEYITQADDNIAIGVDAAVNLIDGKENFFLGDNVAANLTTGSYNIFVGHDIGQNMITGDGNISIGGDNLENGRDNQVNIGSVFYFDGDGYTEINSDLDTGIGTTAVATRYTDDIFTATLTNPVTITTYLNGLTTGTRIFINGIVGTTELNQAIYFTSWLGTDTNNYQVAELYHDKNLTQPVDGTGFTAYVSSGTVYLLKPVGAVTVFGGVGIEGNLIVTDETHIYSSMWVKEGITGVITTATNLEGGALGSLPYQTGNGATDFIPIGATDTVLTSDGSTASWQTLGSITVGGSINSDNSFINTVTSEVVYFPVAADTIGNYTPLNADVNWTYVTTTATTSTFYVTGTSVLNVPGSVYSNEGNEYEQYLLYTPRITVSSTPPPNARVGDFWINSVSGYELQYIQDGANKIWIQFTSL